MRIVIARAPTRIDFGGGWTDVPPYATEQGGRVCNVAIDRYAEFTLSSALPTMADVRSAADSALATAVARHFGVTGVASSLRSDFPTGAGLGGSSAVGVAMVAAFRHWLNRSTDDRAAIAMESRAIEVDEAGIPGGWQDHFAAAMGGALDLTFGATTVARPITLNDRTCDALAMQCLVVYTGQSRISSDTITGVLDGWRRGDRAVVESLERMRELAGEMCVALGAGDLDALGELLAAHWRFQRALHPAIPTERIDAILATALAHGARGGKALGASGGGCVAVLAPPHAVERVRAAIAPLGRPVPFTVDRQGVTVTETTR